MWVSMAFSDSRDFHAPYRAYDTVELFKRDHVARCIVGSSGKSIFLLFIEKDFGQTTHQTRTSVILHIPEASHRTIPAV
jgi:hypothetical protein